MQSLQELFKNQQENHYYYYLKGGKLRLREINSPSVSHQEVAKRDSLQHQYPSTASPLDDELVLRSGQPHQARESRHTGLLPEGLSFYSKPFRVFFSPISIYICCNSPHYFKNHTEPKSLALKPTFSYSFVAPSAFNLKENLRCCLYSLSPLPHLSFSCIHSYGVVSSIPLKWLTQAAISFGQFLVLTLLDCSAVSDTSNHSLLPETPSSHAF